MALKISRILHAGYIFECDNDQIAFDPIFENPFSQNCHAFPNVEFDHEKIKKLKLAAVFISHFHDDHCSLESLNFLDRQTPIYVYCIFEELIPLIRELGFLHVYQLVLNVPVRVGAIEVIPLRALDVDVDSIFHIKAKGLNVLNIVDSWIDFSMLDQLAESAPWDLVLWPFQTMREIEVLAPSRASVASGELPNEWIDQLKILNPKYVVPSSCQFVLESWSWYNQAFFPITYRQFKLEVESALPNVNIVRMNPGVAITLDKNSVEISSSLNWVRPVGDQDVDYQYKANLTPPATAEISQKFASLTEEQTKWVLDYCRSGLIKKFISMDSSTDEYFEKPRRWRLALYDHTGAATYFYYNLNGGSIELTSAHEQALSWSTEVPISKLYAALVNGESLTSMYLRINDCIFEHDIEKEIQHVDIIEDPLVRCLFSGKFGAYQRAQLKRLKTGPQPLKA